MALSKRIYKGTLMFTNDFTVLIDRENLSKAYDLELKESFLPKIIEAVKNRPF